MPNTNCCMPLRHATSKRHKQLSWHALPIDPTLTVAISNDTLKVEHRSVAYIFKASDGCTTSIRLRYSHIPFKKLVSQLFYVSYTNECCIFAIARRRLLELASDSFQSREKVTGAPHAVIGCREHRSIFAGSNVRVYSSYWNYYTGMDN